MNFTKVTIDWYNSTFVFYICLIIGCYLFTDATQNTVVISFNKKRVYVWSVVVTAVLLFVKGFGTTGRDLRTGYYYNFSNATSLSAFPDYTVETGYRLLNVIIRNITEQYYMFIFITACLSIFPVINLLKKYQERIDLPVAILMYVSIFFFNGLSSIRMNLAAAFGLFAFDSMAEKKSIKALVWIVIASFFHFTALVLIVPYFFSLAKGSNKKVIAFSLVVFFFGGYVGRNSLTSLMAGSDRYYIYNSFEAVHIGAEQLIYYIPLLVIFFYGRKQDIDKHFAKLAFSYLATAFCFGMLGYIISIFGRFRDIFVPIIFIVPYYTKRLKQSYPRHRHILNILILIYCLARFYIHITQYYNMEDLMPYTNILGWII